MKSKLKKIMTAKKNKKKQYPIYVLSGKDKALVDQKCRALLDDLLDEQERSTALVKPDPDKVTVSEVFDELRTLPFLAEKRVVLLKNADSFVTQNREILERYFKDPSTSGILILTLKTFRSNTKLYKILNKTGKHIKISEPKSWKIPSMVIEHAKKKYEKIVTKPASELLVELAGDELAVVYSELEKLVLYVDKEPKITERHVTDIVGNNRFFNVFAVIDAATAGKSAEAVDRLRRMFEEDRSAEYTSVGAFAYHFRKMFTAKTLLDKGLPQNEVSKRLRIFGSRKQIFTQLRKLRLKHIGNMICELAEIDYGIKTGRANARVAIEQLVTRLAMV